jgi:hypothetical protein
MTNCTGGIKVSLLALTVADRVFEPSRVKPMTINLVFTSFR